MSAYIHGQLGAWPTKNQMAKILRQGGLSIVVGDYSLRVQDCSHFVFQEYGGDLGDPVIDADADTVEEAINDGNIVSVALARAGIIHRFEIYNERDELAGYLHYEWPLEKPA